MKTKKPHNGFTLLEVMVSFALLSILFGTILSFLVTTLKGTQFTRQELIAHGLSEEGLEMVRALRDKRFLDCENQNEPCAWKSFVTTSFPSCCILSLRFLAIKDGLVVCPSRG